MAKRRYNSDAQAAESLAEALQELPDKWLACRDMRHAWLVEEDFHVTVATGRRPQEIKRLLVCMRCAVEREETYHPVQGNGLERVHSHYRYPSGYQLKGVPRGNKPSWMVQQEQYRRSMTKMAKAARKKGNGS